MQSYWLYAHQMDPDGIVVCSGFSNGLMDDMETALNEAHQLERKAETLLRKNKFDEAIICHQQTADLLLEAMKLTQVDKALESVKLQHDYHLRRQDIIRYKRALLQKVTTMSKQASKLTADIFAAGGGATVAASPPQVKVPADLRRALYNHLEETDSLLLGLVGRITSPTDQLARTVFKKDDKVVIEELRVNNDNLRSLVERLVNELADLQNDNDDLRAQLHLRDMELAQYRQRRHEQPLKVVTADDGSPFSALSPGGDELDLLDGASSRDLPPLEMPSFDYESFASASAASLAPTDHYRAKF